MKLQTLNPFPRNLYDTVDHPAMRTGPRRVTTRLLTAMLALGLPLMQTAPAIAGEQVLEIPQLVATTTAPPSHRRVPDLYDTTPFPSSDADAYASGGTATDAIAPNPQPPAKVAANSESYPPGPNVGSINDYQNQPGETGRQPSIALGRGASRSEPPASMTANLILGGILVGMVALEIASAHHRHR